MKRKMLAVVPKVAKLVEDEVERRNKNRKPGEPIQYVYTVTEEAIVTWSEGLKK